MKIQSIYKKAALKGYGRDRYIQENFIPLNLFLKNNTINCYTFSKTKSFA